MRNLLLLLLLFSPEIITAQKYDWSYGQAQLSDGSIIKSQMAFDPLLREGLLLIKEKNQIKSLTPSHVNSFIIFQDQEIKDKRKFYSLPLENKKTGYVRNYFLEVHYESAQIALLSRDLLLPKNPDRKVKKVNNYTSTTFSALFMISAEDTDLKIICRDFRTGRYTSNKMKNKVIYSFFDEHSKRMKDYIEENNIKLKRMDGLIQALKYFNELNKRASNK